LIAGMDLARPERLLRLARDIADGQSDFHTVKGPGVGDRATLTYMAALREAARHAFGVDLSEFRGCGATALAADFYFPDEGVMVEIALGLPNPGSEFEKDIVKALMAKELGHDVQKLMFISRPGATKKCGQPGRRAMIDWARERHGIEIEVHELNGEPRPPRVRRRAARRVESEDPSR